MLGASTNEILLVVLLVFVVMLAPKVGRIGEAVGGLFTAKRDATPPVDPKAERGESP